MSRLRESIVRLFGMLWPRRRDPDLEEELKLHLELAADDLGSPRAARIHAGGTEQAMDSLRDQRGVPLLDDLAHDIRYAMRGLRKNWGFSLGAGAVLALAIGANVAIFSVVNTVLIQPLAYPDADRIVSVETFWTNTGKSGQVSGPDFLDWKAKNDVFEKITAYYSGDTGGTDDAPVILGDRATFANPRYVAADFFEVFGQRASAGRLLTEGDYAVARGAIPVTVLRYEWAVAQFGSAEAAIGKRLTVDGGPLQVVGVAAPGFRYPGFTDLWGPYAPDPGVNHRSNHEWIAVGKLKAGTDLRLAQAQMRTIGDALGRQYPENRLKSIRLTPLQESLTGNLQTTLWVLMGAVGAVWLIGCFNIANLLLARSAIRTREIALRSALGAGRFRVLRQLLTENCVLAGVAGLVGVLLAWMLVHGVVALAPADLPRIEDVRMDKAALLFALGLSLMSTLIFGLVPALQTSRRDLSDGLKQSGSKTTASKASTRLRSTMVIAEVALSVVLLAAAGLLLRSFQTLQHVDLGFTTDRVLVASAEYTVGDNPAGLTARIRFFEDVLARLRAVPGVSAASGVAFLGMGREPRPPRDYFVEGRPEGKPGERPQAEMHAITSDYFKTLEIPVLAGRDFDKADTEDRPRVTIINQTMARIAFGTESPVGRRVRVGSRAPWMEIVGVVGDIRWQDPAQPPPPVFYAPSTQRWGNSLSILARTSLDQTALTGTLRSILHDANPTVPVKFETMDELFNDTLAYPRFRTEVIGLFAGLATVLAAVGIFSVLAYLVGQRKREIAVRQALGAQNADILRLIMNQGLPLVAIGLVLGLAGALAAARLLTGLLFGISPWDAITYLGTIAVLGTAALIATLVPAIRAITITPTVVLRQE
jgi:putative ABC transport system permease protein